jgi:N4-gp56 family major capsid protein
MANAYINTGVGSFGNTNTNTAGIGGTYGAAGLLQKAYDKVLDFKLRSEPMYRTLADKKAGSLTNNSNQVIFQIYKDLAAQTTALDEVVDPDLLGMDTPDYVAVIMKEYGNMVARTKASKMYAFTDFDPAVANIVAFNMVDSIDKLVSNVVNAGTNVLYSGDATATNNIATSTTPANNDVLTSRDIRKAITKLRSASVAPKRGSLYQAMIHPEVSHDLRAETDAAAWRTPGNYINDSKLIAGEIGSWEGAFFIESPRMFNAGDGANVGSALVPSAIVVTALQNTNLATVTVPSTTTLSSGNFVAISGATGNTSVNGTWQITVISATQFTFTGPNAGVGALVLSSTTPVGGTLSAQKKTKVYRSLIAGQQALAEAVAEEPHSVVAPVTDNFGRFLKVGWYGALGWSLYRPEALWRIESASSVD